MAGSETKGVTCISGQFDRGQTSSPMADCKEYARNSLCDVKFDTTWYCGVLWLTAFYVSMEILLTYAVILVLGLKASALILALNQSSNQISLKACNCQFHNYNFRMCYSLKMEKPPVPQIWLHVWTGCGVASVTSLTWCGSIHVHLLYAQIALVTSWHDTHDVSWRVARVVTSVARLSCLSCRACSNMKL